MNELYAKTALYAYSHIDKVAKQIDEIVEKQASTSMTNFSPCIGQCEKIVFYSCQKALLMKLKFTIDGVIQKFTDRELAYLDYKYFRKNPKINLSELNFSNRNYFRIQNRLTQKFAKRLERAGIDDGVFEKEMLRVDFLRDLLCRVKEHELNSLKNKTTPNSASERYLNDKRFKGTQKGFNYQNCTKKDLKISDKITDKVTDNIVRNISKTAKTNYTAIV